MMLKSSARKYNENTNIYPVPRIDPKTLQIRLQRKWVSFIPIDCSPCKDSKYIIGLFLRPTIATAKGDFENQC